MPYQPDQARQHWVATTLFQQFFKKKKRKKRPTPLAGTNLLIAKKTAETEKFTLDTFPFVDQRIRES